MMASTINDIHKPDLRRSLGIVLQDTNLFTGTVQGKHPLRQSERHRRGGRGRRRAGQRRRLYPPPAPGVRHHAHRQTVPNLSQGQRQLIAIARAAVADPPVMILDEATSSIDTRTEAIVQRGMDSLMTGRTVFVIAHRLSTVRNSDAIMVLDHGRIVERGDHEDLIRQHGLYYQLYTGAFELE